MMLMGFVLRTTQTFYSVSDSFEISAETRNNPLSALGIFSRIKAERAPIPDGFGRAKKFVSLPSVRGRQLRESRLIRCHLFLREICEPIIGSMARIIDLR